MSRAFPLQLKEIFAAGLMRKSHQRRFDQESAFLITFKSIPSPKTRVLQVRTRTLVRSPLDILRMSIRLSAATHHSPREMAVKQSKDVQFRLGVSLRSPCSRYPQCKSRVPCAFQIRARIISYPIPQCLAPEALIQFDA
jgi:hypothetical protein